MKKNILSLIVLCFVLINISIGQTKFGYVNSDTILKELPEAQEASKKLESNVKEWQDDVEKRAKQLQAKYEDYQKQQLTMKEDIKQQRQKALIDEEQKINEFRQQKFGQQGELAMQRERLMAPIKEKIFKAIDKVAKNQKVDIVFDKAGDVLILYADSKLDLTYKILDYLKRGDEK
ncbi:MAG: OmpH family outer membrane protein [Bacteroidetes bacterium]|nr:OmpH family outer membrane protein [Bacteroidota bacterium]